MAYVSHVAGQSRFFDHVYDPIFEASSQKDIWKANVRALHRSTPIEITSIYQTMFSDMPNRPGYMFWKRQNSLPHFSQLGAMPSKSGCTQGVERRKQICVAGACRCHFFHHPADCVRTVNVKINLPSECICVEAARNICQNVGCQTIYRESSAQTRPYLPDYFVAGGERDAPDVVRTANLIAGDQVPGEFEAKIIERSRKRRQWEKELCPTGSLNESHQRQTILEAFEWEEFLAREQDIQEMQELRMQLVVNLMKKREKTMRTASAAKLKNTSFRIEEERKEKLKKLNHKYNRGVRKLELAHKNVSRKYHMENIVKEHADQGSDLYAPQMRFGIHPKRLHFVPFKSSFQARLEGLECAKIDAKSLECHVQKYDKLAAPKFAVTEVEKGFNNDKHLTKLYESLKALRACSKDSKSLPGCLRKIHREKALAAETQVGTAEDLYESAETLCYVSVQKIIKGCAVQKILYRGRDKCRGLIQEIQTTHMLSAVDAMYAGVSNQVTRGKLTIQFQQKLFAQKVQQDNQTQDIFRESEAGILGVLLDFLEKELRRLYEQRKIHALCMLAERERMKREAAEAGRRQLENRRRQETEEIHGHILKASQDTVNMYLENLLLEETDMVAADEARKQVQATARRIDQEVSKSMNDKYQSVEINDNDDVVDDLVKNFMFPEVQKRIARTKSEARRHRHLNAAHESLYGHIKNVCYDPPRRSSKSLIAGEILNSLLDNVLSVESVSSEIEREDDTAKHETASLIRKILKKALPRRKWKTSAERIASATMSALLNDTVTAKQVTPIHSVRVTPTTSEQDKLSQQITNQISECLWKYAFDDEMTVQNSEDDETFNSADLFNYIEARLQPIVAQYEVGHIEAENEYVSGESDSAACPIESVHMLMTDSNTNEEIEAIEQSSRASVTLDYAAVEADIAETVVIQDDHVSGNMKKRDN